MRTILVVANETLGGRQAARRRQGARPRRAATRASCVCVPRTQPKHGNIIYDDFVFDAAKVRIDLARALPARGRASTRSARSATPTPTRATMDAVARAPPGRDHHLDLPGDVVGLAAARPASSASRRPPASRSTHVVADIDAEGLPFDVTLVVAAKTASAATTLLDAPEGQGAPATTRALVHRRRARRRAATGRGAARARARMAQVVDRLRRRGPARRRHDRRPRPVHGDDERAAVLPRRRHRHLDAARDALGLAARRPHRARPHAPPTSPSSTSRPAEPRAERRLGAVRAMEAAAIPRPRPRRHGHDHHGPPEANRSSRVEPAAARDAAVHHLRDHGLRGLLHGLLLHPGRRRRPRRGSRSTSTELPKLDRRRQHRDPAVSSSLTLHWAQTAIKHGNRFALQGRAC